MSSRIPQGAFVLFLLVACTAAAQVMSIPSSGFGDMSGNFGGSSVGLGLLSSEAMTNNLFAMTTNAQSGANQSPSASVSKLDLKAPWKARREYDKGYQLLMRKDFQDALQHLASAGQQCIRNGTSKIASFAKREPALSEVEGVGILTSMSRIKIPRTYVRGIPPFATNAKDEA
jgi:hypothetical protein